MEYSLWGEERVLMDDAVPVNLKTEDKFHLTVEEYLHAVITLVEELVCSSSYRSLPFFFLFSFFFL